MPYYEVAIEARKNDTAEKCMFSAWIRGENTPKAVEEALQKVAYEHPNFGMLRPVCVEEQKLVAAYWQGTSAPRRQWKIVHKYKVEYKSPVSNRELLRRCSEQALQEELKINDMRESKDHILPGGSAEAQRADMLRAMEAVSAKMAAERGITRQPLAVLSQNEISRRMKAI